MSVRPHLNATESSGVSKLLLWTAFVTSAPWWVSGRCCQDDLRGTHADTAAGKHLRMSRWRLSYQAGSTARPRMRSKRCGRSALLGPRGGWNAGDSRRRVRRRAGGDTSRTRDSDSVGPALCCRRGGGSGPSASPAGPGGPRRGRRVLVENGLGAGDRPRARVGQRGSDRGSALNGPTRVSASFDPASLPGPTTLGPSEYRKGAAWQLTEPSGSHVVVSGCVWPPQRWRPRFPCSSHRRWLTCRRRQAARGGPTGESRRSLRSATACTWAAPSQPSSTPRASPTPPPT